MAHVVSRAFTTFTWGCRKAFVCLSECSLALHTVQKMGAVDALWDMLDGIFACVLFDARTGEFCAARDPIGICPLYWGRSADGGTWFCSELKGLQAQCEHFDIFPPARPGPLVFCGETWVTAAILCRFLAPGCKSCCKAV